MLYKGENYFEMFTHCCADEAFQLNIVLSSVYFPFPKVSLWLMHQINLFPNRRQREVSLFLGAPYLWIDRSIRRYLRQMLTPYVIYYCLSGPYYIRYTLLCVL